MPIAAATHTSAVFWFLPLLGLLLIGVVMFRWSRRAKTTTTPAAGGSGA
jgi:cytochrome c-type biogenesis protein CcmH/NrfF